MDWDRDFGGDPEECDILLVSAPGAVGKSTLAKEIASQTGSIYVDLAEAEPVGAGSLSGGLFHPEIHKAWSHDQLTVLIDGLDEALLKITYGAYEAYLSDIAERAKGRTVPTILFGRTGAVEQAYLELQARASVSVLEIGYFSVSRAVELAMAEVKRIMEDKGDYDRFPVPRRKVIANILQNLSSKTESENGRFAGYAPVILAVARRVAEEANPSTVSPEEAAPPTLRQVGESILDREQHKLHTLEFEDPGLKDVLYSPEEQQHRLFSLLYSGQDAYRPESYPHLPQMSTRDNQTYKQALESWLEDHPFYDQAQRQAQSKVFAAMICSWALRGSSDELAAVAAARELSSTPNPFLADLILREDDSMLEASYVGLVYGSLRAALADGEVASLEIEDDEESDKAKVMMQFGPVGAPRAREVELVVGARGVLKFGGNLEDVDISYPRGTVEIGSGAEEMVLFVPVQIECKDIVFRAPKLTVDRREHTEEEHVQEGSVFLAANSVLPEPAGLLERPMVLRGELAVAFPERVKGYPWTECWVPSVEDLDDAVSEGLRRLTNFVLVFRRGQRSRKKIESKRLARGTGATVLKFMRAQRILVGEGWMYRLDRTRLFEETGMSFVDWQSRRYGVKAEEFVQRALDAESRR